MFPFGARVITRNGTQGNMVRQLTNHPPHQFLVQTFDCKTLIVFHEDLRLAADIPWSMISDKPWNGVERRNDQRRQRERRRDGQNGADQLTSDRRVADRRQAERRWIVAD
jgi:hypothetical protein